MLGPSAQPPNSGAPPGSAARTVTAREASFFSGYGRWPRCEALLGRRGLKWRRHQSRFAEELPPVGGDIQGMPVLGHAHSKQAALVGIDARHRQAAGIAAAPEWAFGGDNCRPVAGVNETTPGQEYVCRSPCRRRRPRSGKASPWSNSSAVKMGIWLRLGSGDHRQNLPGLRGPLRTVPAAVQQPLQQAVWRVRTVTACIASKRRLGSRLEAVLANRAGNRTGPAAR